jgi:hypothetical protein
VGKIVGMAMMGTATRMGLKMAVKLAMANIVKDSMMDMIAVGAILRAISLRITPQSAGGLNAT